MMHSRDARVLVAETAERAPICGYLVAELQHRPPMVRRQGPAKRINGKLLMRTKRAQGHGTLRELSLPDSISRNTPKANLSTARSC